jgi:hypothetical protein
MRVYLTMIVTLAAAGMILATACLSQTVHRPTPKQEENLKKFLQDYLRDPHSSLEDEKTTRYSAAFVDLKNDGKHEVIVYITGRFWCGSGGCVMLILAPDDSSYRVVTRTTITRLPVRILVSKSHGWHDISVQVQGGGIVHVYEAELSFDGRTYPSNPTVPPARRLVGKVAGEVAIPLDVEGKPLYP